MAEVAAAVVVAVVEVFICILYLFSLFFFQSK